MYTRISKTNTTKLWKININKNNLYLILFIIIIFIILYLIYIKVGKALLYKYKKNLKVQNLSSYIYVYNEIFLENDYQYLDTKHFNKNNKEIYFDVGGNNGIYSLYLNDKNDNIEVHVFEPIKDLYDNIQWNINQNKKRDNNYIINNIGLGNKNENLKINFMPNADGLSTIKDDLEDKKTNMINSKCENFNYPLLYPLCKNIVSNLLNEERLKVEKKDIKIVRFSDYIKEHNINFVDKIKVDIEGYELEFLEGINKEDFSKIGAFVIEVENYRNDYKNKITNILKNNNFSFEYFENNDKNNWIMIYAINNLYK
jgi:FkbM family methyltransferase